MKKLLLYILEKIPYRNKWGLSLADLLKYWYYQRNPNRDFCFCGGKIRTFSCPPDGWTTECIECNQLYDED